MKLKLNTSQVFSTNASSSHASQTPSSGLKLTFGRSQELNNSPASFASPLNQTEASGSRLESSRIQGPKSKKRSRDIEEQTSQTLSNKKQVANKTSHKRIRLSTGKSSLVKLKTAASSTTPLIAPRLKLKSKGKPLPRPAGVGYDSEAEDAEDDPAIEENLILRMEPGPDCDYLRTAIEGRNLGLQTAHGGADVTVRFFSKDARRGVINIQGRHYAMVLVDLPCIIETMKSWDKRGWWKSGDISQMLVVIGQVPTEDGAKTVSVPKEADEKTSQWPHGLTPPMHNVRARRFRKRVSYRTIEAAEEEVERLILADEQAKTQKGTTSYEVLDLDRLRSQEPESGDDDTGEEHQERMGFDFVDEYAIMDDEDEDDEATAKRLQMELDLGADDDDGDAGLSNHAVSAEEFNHPTKTEIVSTVSPPGEESSLADAPLLNDGDGMGEAHTVESYYEDINGEEEDEDEESEESDDDDDDEDATDHGESESAEGLAEQKAEIAELKEELETSRAKLVTTVNQTLRQRLLAKIAAVEGDLEVKRRAIGESDDDI